MQRRGRKDIFGGFAWQIKKNLNKTSSDAEKSESLTKDASRCERSLEEIALIMNL